MRAEVVSEILRTSLCRLSRTCRRCVLRRSADDTHMASRAFSPILVLPYASGGTIVHDAYFVCNPFRLLIIEFCLLSVVVTRSAMRWWGTRSCWRLLLNKSEVIRHQRRIGIEPFVRGGFLEESVVRDDIFEYRIPRIIEMEKVEQPFRPIGQTRST